MNQTRQFITPAYVEKHIYDYQLDEFKNAFNAKDITGANIVEIGGDYHLVSARLFSANGAASVISTSLANSFSPEPLPANVLVKPVDFSKLQEKNTVDLIYGVAVLEHIPDVEQIAKAIDRLLAPNGMAILHGCPLWAGPDGHHIWLYENQIKGFADAPCDPSNPIYCFNNPEKNPIPDWAHCVSEPNDLLGILRASGKSKNQAEAIVNFVYNLDGKSFGESSNRKSGSQLVREFGKYFDVSADRVLAQNAENNFYIYSRLHYSDEDLRTAGIRLKLTKKRPTPLHV